MGEYTDTVKITIDINTFKFSDNDEVKQRIIEDLKFLVSQLEQFDVQNVSAGDQFSLITYTHVKN